MKSIRNGHGCPPPYIKLNYRIHGHHHHCDNFEHGCPSFVSVEVGRRSPPSCLVFIPCQQQVGLRVRIGWCIDRGYLSRAGRRRRGLQVMLPGHSSAHGAVCVNVTEALEKEELPLINRSVGRVSWYEGGDSAAVNPKPVKSCPALPKVIIMSLTTD